MKFDYKPTAKLAKTIQYSSIEYVINCGGIENAIRELDLSDFGEDEKKTYESLAKEIERMRKEGLL